MYFKNYKTSNMDSSASSESMGCIMNNIVILVLLLLTMGFFCKYVVTLAHVWTKAMISRQ